MSTLTKQERDGLEDVFISIHTRTKYEKLKSLSHIILLRSLPINCKKLLKQATLGVKETKTPYFFLNFDKKKKNLSK